MRTAFIVLTYNRSDALLQVLRALAPQCGAGHEVLVADDGSRPEHVQALRSALPGFACRVRHVWHPDVGFTAARARNAAAARSDADYLVFLDGDCVPSRRFVREQEALARPGQFLIGGRVLLEERLTHDVLAGRVDLQSLTALDWLRLRLSGQVNKLTHLFEYIQARGRMVPGFRWKGIRSCNMAVWRSDFAKVNGFDEAFEGWGHEDADIVLRLHNAGIARCNAWLGTDVYHLWHRQNSRADEAANRQRVLQRLDSGMIRAEAGLAEALHTTDTVVTELNR
jgi:GT2 family glycosyltransferase